VFRTIATRYNQHLASSTILLVAIMLSKSSSSHRRAVALKPAFLKRLRGHGRLTQYLQCLRSNCRFSGEHGSTSSSLVNLGQPTAPHLSSSTCSGREPLWISGTGFYKPNTIRYDTIRRTMYTCAQKLTRESDQQTQGLTENKPPFMSLSPVRVHLQLM